MKKNKKPSNLRFKAHNRAKAYFPIRLFLKISIIAIVCLVLFKSVFVYADTFKRVGKITGVNYKVLISVAYVESGLNPYAVDVDGRAYFYKSRARAARAIKKYVREYGSVDIGLMQVNYEIWGRYLNLSVKKLLEPKINILIGAFILSHYIRKYGYSWKTIGRYHSAENWSNYNYRNKVRAIYGILRENRQH